jgi:hypothetical protein
MRRRIRAAVLMLGISAAPVTAEAAEISHFVPGVMNIRDYFVPEPGFYGALYNYYYTTDRLNDRHGDEVDSVTVNPGPGPGLTIDVDVDVDLYALAPGLIWVSNWRILGAKYAAYVAPSFSTTSISANLSVATGIGGSIDNDPDMGVGDLFVQPLWLGWDPKHWDIGLAYGFYAPVGRYDTRRVSFPGGRSVEVESADNLGLGFWTHQFQGALAWYPWLNKATALTAVVTYEINQNKQDFDLTPGQNLTFNWGVSQYLPLTKDQRLLLELGPAGYCSWQITRDTGSDAAASSPRDQVQAAGGQIGLTYIPWYLVFNFHAFAEFASEERFQGQAYGINLAKKF